MSFVVAAPEALVAAASNISGIGSTIDAASAAASLPTSGVVAAAADAVSAQVAALFSAHGEGFQQFSAQVSALHEKFVQALTETASSYAAADSNAAQTLMNALSTPAQTLTEQAVSAGSAFTAPFSNTPLSGAVANFQSLISSAGTGVFGGPGQLPNLASLGGALLQRPTGGAIGLAASAPAAFQPIVDGIENAYNQIEPWVAYGFNLLAWAVGYLPLAGILAPQINYLYYLFEPMVQASLFNTLDWLSGSISFSQGLSNFWGSTTASINQFITNEIYWVSSFLPPLPPVP